MASIRKTINGALKSLGVVGGHGQTATDQELLDCLETIHGIYHQFISSGYFGRLHDVIPRGDYILGENQRVFRKYNEYQQILLPDVVSDCGYCGYRFDTEDTSTATTLPTTDYGAFETRTRVRDNRRAIRDLSIAVINDEISGTTDEAIYDASQKKWFVISHLDRDFDMNIPLDVSDFNELLNEEMPLSHRDPLGLRAYVAIQIADLFAAEPTPIMMKNAMLFERNLATRFGERKQDTIYSRRDY